MNQGYCQPNMYYGGGYQYASRQQPLLTQPLTADEIKKLRNRGTAFSLQIDAEEALRAVCTHKESGNFTLRENNDGTSTCMICGETFTMAIMDEAAVQASVDLMVDILQMIKTYYLDIPVEVARQFFQMVPLIKRVPKLYKIALENFNQYDRGAGVQHGGSMYGFNMLNALTGPGVGNPMMMGAPGGMAPGMMPGYPMPGAPMPGYPMPGVMPGGNPFGYQAGGYPQGPGGYPVQGYPQQPCQPPVAPQACDPNQGQGQPAAPQQPAQVTTNKSFNV